jgi:polyisoprenoid-binding protein YceI
VQELARYDIVPERSQVWIDATSSVHPIHSCTDGLEGFIELEVQRGGQVDLRVAPEGRLSLPVERLSSGSRLEDQELRRRIDARRYRSIDGRLVEMRAAGRDGQYLVRGEVTFRGVTNFHEGEMTIAQLDDTTLQLDGRSTFDIRDFGMEPPRILMLRVHPQVTVTVSILARRKD